MIHCANCIHCKVFLRLNETETMTVKRVRCARGHWTTKGISERMYLYHTVDRRTVESCADYECAGDEEDTKQFIIELRRDLPVDSYVDGFPTQENVS